MQEPCEQVELVFARGSGQGVGKSEETNRFDQVLRDTLGDINLKVNLYELGSEPQNGQQYKAVSIDWQKHTSNLVGSEFSWGTWFGSEYRQSVKDGANEFLNYMRERSLKCKDSVFVVGGYSQGAQAIGDALPYLPDEIADRIVHVSFFGDPKLYLPEGEGERPSACKGEGLSSWRRGTVLCNTRQGVLEARNPYLPVNFMGKTGSWCNNLDTVCTNNLAEYASKAHESYKMAGGAIDEAAKEAAAEVAKILDMSELIVKSYDMGFGTTGFDLALVLDSSLSMDDNLGQMYRYTEQLADTVLAMNGRVGVVEFRDKGDVFVTGVETTRLKTDFTTDKAAIDLAIRGTYAEGGGDLPEAALSGLMSAFNEMNWRSGATKVAIVVTDSTYHDPDEARGYTLDDVVRRALELDPVSIYPIVPQNAAFFYVDMAERTTGKVIAYETRGAQMQASLELVLADVRSKPVVLLNNLEYFARPGDTVYFDASRSYDPDSDITAYEWDFDADGVFDKTTNTPTVSHVYDAPHEGLMEVRVRSADGGVSNGSAVMHIKSEPVGGNVPTVLAGLKATSKKSGDTQTISLSWNASQNADYYKIYANDEFMGATNGPLTGVKINDVPSTGSLQFAVAASNKYGDGQIARVAITENSQEQISEPEVVVKDEIGAEGPAVQRPAVHSLAPSSSIIAVGGGRSVKEGYATANLSVEPVPSVLDTGAVGNNGNGFAGPANAPALADKSFPVVLVLLGGLVFVAIIFGSFKFMNYHSRTRK